jgi:hypothetical protein
MLGTMPRAFPAGRRWQAFRQVVFSVYGDTCHLCGHPGARQADHLIPVSQRPDLAWELANIRPAHGTKNRCPRCGRCCNQARISGPKRPVPGTEPAPPQLSGALPPPRPRERHSRTW